MTNSNLKLPTLNQVTFTGLVEEPAESLPSVNGTGARFSVGIPPRRPNDAEIRVPCVAWGAIAEALLAKATPGSALLISGALSTRGASQRLHVHVTALQFLEQPS